MCGGICGPAGEMNEGCCSVCGRTYRQCSCLLHPAARDQTKKKLEPMKKAIMSKDKDGLKKRVNKNRKLTKPLRKK